MSEPLYSSVLDRHVSLLFRAAESLCVSSACEQVHVTDGAEHRPLSIIWQVKMGQYQVRERDVITKDGWPAALLEFRRLPAGRGRCHLRQWTCEYRNQGERERNPRSYRRIRASTCDALDAVVERVTATVDAVDSTLLLLQFYCFFPVFCFRSLSELTRRIHAVFTLSKFLVSFERERCEGLKREFLICPAACRLFFSLRIQTLVLRLVKERVFVV